MSDYLSRFRRFETRWGPLALAALMTGWCLWYFLDAYAASARVQNLIFIAPATGIVLCLFVVVLASALRRSAEQAVEDDTQVASATSQQLRTPLAVMALLGLYVAGLKTIGFDVSTFLFVAAALLVQGERRPLHVLIYAAVFAGVVIWIFRAMLTLSMPTLVI